MIEVNFDGLVGPTHNYGGLSPGNVASIDHGGAASNPRAAALQGLGKMRLVRELGLVQGVLPPHERPHVGVLRALGFAGADEAILAEACRLDGGHLLRLVSSAAAMWTANAATVAPSFDTRDGRLQVTPANLQEMFHRSIEPPVTHRALARIFADPARFWVHAPLPGGGQFADEGAANHTRLAARGQPAVHLFAWGRTAYGQAPRPGRFPARQTLEASRALARLHGLDPARCLFPQQSPEGIDAGAFHTDVLAVGNETFFMAHELAFVDTNAVVSELRRLMGDELQPVVARRDELPVAAAVAAYPFNSQILTRPDGTMILLAPIESAESPEAKRFLDRVVAGAGPVTEIRTLDLRQSMHNGGGPACLRLRVPMTREEIGALGARVILDPGLDAELVEIVQRRYRDRLSVADLADPLFLRECRETLDELSRVLRLGDLYDFQR